MTKFEIETIIKFEIKQNDLHASGQLSVREIANSL
jgi:hypothetical protein